MLWLPVTKLRLPKISLLNPLMIAFLSPPTTFASPLIRLRSPLATFSFPMIELQLPMTAFLLPLTALLFPATMLTDPLTMELSLPATIFLELLRLFNDPFMRLESPWI